MRETVKLKTKNGTYGIRDLGLIFVCLALSAILLPALVFADNEGAPPSTPGDTLQWYSLHLQGTTTMQGHPSCQDHTTPVSYSPYTHPYLLA